MSNRKKREITLIVLTILGILVVGGVIFLLLSDAIFYPDRDGRDHGSAGKMKDTTLVYTVFAGDSECAWDENADGALMDEIRLKIDEAESYLVKEAVNYGAIPSFVSDFRKDTSLYAVKEFPVSVHSENGMQELRDAVWKYVDYEVDLLEIMKRYDAVNVVIMVCLKNGGDAAGNVMTVTQYEGMRFPYEMCMIENNEKDSVQEASLYARELLKCFGAKDYELVGKMGEISKEELEIIRSEIPDDIMLMEATDEKKEYRLSELTAYYIGLKEESDIREEHNLPLSEYTPVAQ